MTKLFALTYLSEASRALPPPQLDSILLDARMFNASVEVTGALLYGAGRFFQMLEGTEDAVRTTYARIARAHAHRNLRTLSQGPIEARCFDAWHMGFVEAPESAMQALSQAAWEDAIPYTRSDLAKSEGMGLLLYHWNRWAADTARPMA